MAAARQSAASRSAARRCRRRPRRSGCAPTCRRTIAFDSLPFGTRGGTAIRYHFPLDAEYVDQGRTARRAAPTRTSSRSASTASASSSSRSTAAGPGRRPVSAYDAPDDALEVRVPVKAGPRVVGVDVRQEDRRARRRRCASRSTRRMPKAATAFAAVGGQRHDHRARSAPTGVERHAEPAADLHLPAGRAARPKRRARDRFSRRSRAAPIGGRSTDAELAGAARLLRRWPRDRRVRRRHRTGAAAPARQPGVPVPRRVAIRPGVAPGAAYPAQRSRARVTAVVLPLEQHSRRRAAGRCGQGHAERTGGARAAGAADARRPALRGARRATSPASGCICARSRARSPNVYLFPNFDENLRQDFRRETELFFESILRENRSVLDLLTADYTFVNERLAKHYGIPNVYGSHFRRVTIADDESARPARSGQHPDRDLARRPDDGRSAAASGSWRTSSARRRRRRRRTCRRFTSRRTTAKVLSMRERMEQHRANPVCASCHARMDPLGFALENFDAIGQWRTRDGRTSRSTRRRCCPTARSSRVRRGCEDAARPVPSSSSTAIDREAADLRAGPRARALRCCRRSGRSCETRRASDYRFQSLILGVVNSVPFQMRRTPGGAG